jgi:Ca-activated chloride channel family protein
MSRIWINWEQLVFANPELLVLLVLPLLFGAWQWWRYQQLYPSLTLPILDGIKAYDRPVRGFVKKYLFVLRILAVGFLIVALARPQLVDTEEEINSEGIDIVLAMDISTSMLARDFQPNRMEAAKRKAAEFISNRPNDRIGLVVFARESFTQCPLTTDTTMIKSLLSEIRDGLIEDGTAIGMGLGTAINRLKDSDAKSKVIILMTDGENNSGKIEPLTAVEAAKKFGIRVYTIGVGKRGMAPYKMQSPFGVTYQNQEVRIDEELLTEISKQTNGKYFRATNNQVLEQVYEEINQLETSLIQLTRLTRKSEVFYPFLIIGALLFLLELVLRYTLVRHIP